MPAEVEKRGFVAQVALAVASDLPFPPGAAGFWESEVPAVLMPVPETAVDEDGGVVFRQYDVRFPGKRFVFRAVDRKAESHAVEHRAQG